MKVRYDKTEAFMPSGTFLLTVRCVITLLKNAASQSLFKFRLVGLHRLGYGHLDCNDFVFGLPFG